MVQPPLHSQLLWYAFHLNTNVHILIGFPLPFKILEISYPALFLMTPSHSLSIQLSLLLHWPLTHRACFLPGHFSCCAPPSQPRLLASSLQLPWALPATQHPVLPPLTEALTACWSHPDSSFLPRVGWSLPTHFVINESLDKLIKCWHWFVPRATA